VRVKKIQKNKRFKKKKDNTGRVGKEILGLVILAFGVLSFLSIFFASTIGIFGKYLRSISMGLGGPTAFISPFLLIILGIFILFNKTSSIFKKRFVYTVLLSILLASFYQTSSYIEDDYLNMNFFDAILKFISSGINLTGGGLLGGILSYPFLLLFSKIGTVIILTTLSIIDIILLTNISMENFFDNIVSLAKNTENNISNSKQLKIKDASSKRASKEELSDQNDLNEQDIIKNTEKRMARKIIDFNLEKLKWKKADKENSTIKEMNDNQNKKMDIDLNGDILNMDRQVNESSPWQDIQSYEDSYTAASQDFSSEQTDIDKLITNNIQDEVSKHKTSSKSKNGVSEKLDISIHNNNDTYNYPTIELLNKSTGDSHNSKTSKAAANEGAKKLEETLRSFGVEAKVVNVSRGPAVTRYELSPSPGVKVSKIVNLSDDISLNLAAAGVRIEAPIPGKAAIGIEVPNKNVTPVYLKEVIETDEFKKFPSKLAFAVGKDISGETVVADIGKMPHMLVAGATGSGKSVCINSLLVSILYKASPKEVKLLMIDPKVVELGIYNGIPHLLIPVVTEPKKAAGALNWAVQEMINRYKLFADAGVRDLKGYNTYRTEEGQEALPQIVIIIDELADLMMAAPNEVEDAICRLAQMARAAGMHLVIATQRPSVDVITGVIKANIPSRIAFAVSSQVDSRTIIDMGGAEKLLGKGDMLFYPVGNPKPIRVKGAFVTDKEVERVVEYVKSIAVSEYNEDIIEEINNESVAQENNPGDNDLLLNQAIDVIVDAGQASVSLVQRKFKVGYARAARIIDQMEARGIVGRFEGSKPRQVLISKQQWQELQMSDNKGGNAQ
jgi:S-DNA-T family DNA segregation ATPase FtsK/SpoIIIE